jgi:hypothetical protein
LQRPFVFAIWANEQAASHSILPVSVMLLREQPVDLLVAFNQPPLIPILSRQAECALKCVMGILDKVVDVRPTSIVALRIIEVEDGHHFDLLVTDELQTEAPGCGVCSF